MGRVSRQGTERQGLSVALPVDLPKRRFLPIDQRDSSGVSPGANRIDAAVDDTPRKTSMLRRWLTLGLSAEEEDHFRQAALAADIAQARTCILLILLPVVAFTVNDYVFFGFSRLFYALTAVRLVLVVYTVLFLKYLRGVTSYRSYDRTEFVWGLAFALFVVAITATRPHAFVAHIIVAIIAVFVTVLAIPNRFVNQLVLALVYTLGETLVVAPALWQSPQASVTALLSMFLANAIAVAVARRLHTWRRREFLAREEERKVKMDAERQLVELRRAEEERERLIAELQAAVRELEGFTYSVSHDLRAPIRHIASFAHLLKKDAWPVLNEQNRRHLDTILDSAGRMGILVDGLLEFSRMGRTELKESPVDLDTLVREVISSCAEETKDRNIQWRTDRLPTVRGDSTMLHRVFLNLIGNALKFTRGRSPACIDVGYRMANGEHIITIRDNGVGFDMRYLDKLFGVFQRLHTAEEFEGAGIGLANVPTHRASPRRTDLGRGAGRRRRRLLPRAAEGVTRWRGLRASSSPRTRRKTWRS